MDNDSSIGVGIIGAGERGVYTVGARMAERVHEEHFIVRAISDVDKNRVEEGRRYLEMKYEENGESISITGYTDNASLIEDPAVDLILITTYTATHIESAVPALESKKWVYLDKPIATKVEDSYRILQVEKEQKNPLIMGFTRRYETPWRKAYELLEEGRIGELQMILLRSVIPYARYLQRWHRDHSLSGGAVNDKASHHFDVFNWFSGSEPEVLQAMGGRSSVFAPDPNAPKRCRDCDRVCPYRVLPSDTVKELGVFYTMEKEYADSEARLFMLPSWYNAEEKNSRPDNCVYDPDINIIDHAMVNISYRNGIKADLFLSIFGPVAEDQETLELVGSKGRIQLIRNSGKLDIVGKYGAEHEVIDASDPHIESSHNGADIGLLKDIRGFCFGHEPVARSVDGHKSLRMVHATEKAIEQGGATIRMSEVPYGID